MPLTAFWAAIEEMTRYILTGEKPLIPPPGFVTADEIRGETLLPDHTRLGHKPSPALLAECAQYVRDMQAYGVRNVVMPPPGATETEVAEFAAGLRSRLAELKKNVDLSDAQKRDEAEETGPGPNEEQMGIGPLRR